MKNLKSSYNKKFFERDGGRPYEKQIHKIEERFNYVKRNIRLKKGHRVLDIGCAYGFFLKICDEIGCETYDADLSSYAINRAKKILRVVSKKLSLSKGVVPGLIIL